MRRRTVCESSARTCSTLCVREGERGDAEGDAGDEDDVSVAGEEAVGEVGEDGVGRQGDDELLGDGNGLVSSWREAHGGHEGEREQRGGFGGEGDDGDDGAREEVSLHGRSREAPPLRSGRRRRRRRGSDRA